jgi:hypothetical protein
MNKILIGNNGTRYFACLEELSGKDGDKYFHSDSVFRGTTYNEKTKKFDGWWDSREQLEESLKKKFPDVEISDFKYPDPEPDYSLREEFVKWLSTVVSNPDSVGEFMEILDKDGSKVLDYLNGC